VSRSEGRLFGGGAGAAEWARQSGRGGR
jgi:hypothetical protein